MSCLCGFFWRCSWTTSINGPQSRCEDSQQTEDPQPRCCWENQARDPEPQTVQTPSHHQAVSGE